MQSVEEFLAQGGVIEQETRPPSHKKMGYGRIWFGKSPDIFKHSPSHYNHLPEGSAKKKRYSSR